jgi:putative nucleotidyltransferase with HDIG domain
MIQMMDKAMLALQAAAVGRKLYGIDHPLPNRQTDLAADTLARALETTKELRLVRLDGSLVFQDAELPSCALLREVLIPRLAAHGVEWFEFRTGLSRAELLTFADQLEGAPAESGRLGTPNIRLGRLGRTEGGDDAASDPNATLDTSGQVAQLKQVWKGLYGGDRPDKRLGDLVESIQLAVAVGADVCNRLAEVKSHDEYTFVHTVNVGILSAALGEAVGMTAGQVFDLILAALLHDVGKQRTPLAILNKPGRLDDPERKQMEMHPVTGAAMLLERPGVPDVAPIVAFEHHANLDGTGYPKLTRHGRPHVASQIVHVADVFDALRTNRPYRAALDDARVRQILQEGAGKAFDPGLVELFLDRVITANASGKPKRMSA